MDREGTEIKLKDMFKGNYFENVHDYCTGTWCVWDESVSLFKSRGKHYEDCEAPPPDDTVESALDKTDEDVKKLCKGDTPCLVDGSVGGKSAAEETLKKERALEAKEEIPEDAVLRNKAAAPKPKKSSASGDPHFKSWTGDKYDYHGECDLVLLNNPTFHNGMGLRIHVRTTGVKYFSYIEKIAIQIGDDALEFDNDVEDFLINGEKVGQNKKHHQTMFAGFLVRHDTNALSIHLVDFGAASHHGDTVAKIDLHSRKNGFPAVVVDGGNTDTFRGSLGLLGDWETGRLLGRNGTNEIGLDGGDATAFAVEWQVRDTEPLLFQEARLPQYPTTCTPPGPRLPPRLGSKNLEKEAEKACDHWKEDKEDCIFDVIALVMCWWQRKATLSLLNIGKATAQFSSILGTTAVWHHRVD